MTQTVQQWIESNGSAIEFQDVIERFGHLKITKEFFSLDPGWQPFPQKRHIYRNVHNWVLLEDGSAMGWNESPTRGWSYPRVGKSTVDSIIK